MDRRETLFVMHEILVALEESVIISGVSLDSLKCPEDYQIKMKCDLDEGSRKSIQPILDKHKLKICQQKGTLTIISF